MIEKVKIIYRNLRYLFRLLVNYKYDLQRYFKYSTRYGISYTQSQLIARITASYHVVEKGLSFPELKLGFGIPNIRNLKKLLELYIEREYDTKNIAFLSAVNVLKKYKQFHDDHEYEMQWLDISKYEGYEKVDNVIDIETIRNIQDSNNFLKLAITRYSVRTFSNKEVNEKLIQDAVQIALKTPSVCNRQSWKAYCIGDKILKNRILNLQKGNRGFGHLINKLLVITSDINSFNGANERYQPFIDGGLFSMSVIYALHSKGLATCPLNWSVEKNEDILLRKELKIGDNEIVIMLVAIGHYPEKLKVPMSNRKSISDTLKFL
jgi:nitroreductase